MIDRALILAAGHGSRLRTHITVPHKALVELGGQPILRRTCQILDDMGIRKIIVVTGHEGSTVRSFLTTITGLKAKIEIVHNERWKEANGLSVLAAASELNAPYLLLMADHLFDPNLINMMAQKDPKNGVVLAVDRKLESIYDMDDATKVVTVGKLIEAIDKNLTDFDAVDTGLFACSGALVEHLTKIESRKGDCSLTDGMKSLANERKLQAVDVGNAWWQDIDTPGSLKHGAKLLAANFHHPSRIQMLSSEKM